MTQAKYRSREVMCYQAADRRGLVLSKSKRKADRGAWYVYDPNKPSVLFGGPGTTLEQLEEYLRSTTP